MACWSLATPLYAAPDEPSHVMRAAGLVRGELFGQLNLPNTPPAEGLVELPKFYSVARKIPDCYHKQAGVPASCAPSSAALAALPPNMPTGLRCGDSVAPPEKLPNTTCVSFDYTARYPPLYYAIVGLPSLLESTDAALYLMRLLAAVLCAALVALAITATVLWSRSRLLLGGLVVGATPMVLYLGGVVNPSGLEVAAAICAWTTGAILLVERRGAPPRGLLVICAVSAGVFVASRSISPLWVVCAGVVLCLLGGWRRLAELGSRRDVQVALGILGLVAVACVVWTVREHALDVLITSTNAVPRSVAEVTILENSFAHNSFYLPSMIGVFGSFDTNAPLFTYVVWYGLIGLVVGGAAVASGRRDRLVLGSFTLAILVLPVLVSSSQAHTDGYTWNGRDTLPFALGLPIVAAVLLARVERGTLARKFVGGTALAAGCAQFAAFYEALRRYAVGTHGPAFGFIAHPSWAPPLSVPGALLLEAAVLVLGGLGAYRLAAQKVPSEPDELNLGPPVAPE